MWPVSFEEWLKTLRRRAESLGIELSSNDEDHREFYDNGDTPKGALDLINTYGYE